MDVIIRVTGYEDYLLRMAAQQLRKGEKAIVCSFDSVALLFLELVC